MAYSNTGITGRILAHVDLANVKMVGAGRIADTHQGQGPEHPTPRIITGKFGSEIAKTVS